MSENLAIERTGPALIVRFVRPERRNPLSREVVASLHELVDDLSNDATIRKVVFTGSGDTFASGANLNEIAALSAGDASEFARFGQTLMQKIDELPQMTIAAINGYCFGGAFDLTLACDRRIAAKNATFAHPGTGLGIITGWGGTQRLPRLIGLGNAFEMFFTASPIDADRALAIGLVDEIAEDCLRRAIEVAA
jgi:enoyl-CoA hydratase